MHIFHFTSHICQFFLMKWYINTIRAVMPFCILLVTIWTSSFMNGLFISVLLLMPCAPAQALPQALCSALFRGRGAVKGHTSCIRCFREAEDWQDINLLLPMWHIYALSMPIVFQLYLWHLL